MAHHTLKCTFRAKMAIFVHRIFFSLLFALHHDPFAPPLSRELLADDNRFAVPSIIPELSTKRVLTAELIHGLPLDHCTHLPQQIKDEVRP